MSFVRIGGAEAYLQRSALLPFCEPRRRRLGHGLCYMFEHCYPRALLALEHSDLERGEISADWGLTRGVVMSERLELSCQDLGMKEVWKCAALDIGWLDLPSTVLIGGGHTRAMYMQAGSSFTQRRSASWYPHALLAHRHSPSLQIDDGERFACAAICPSCGTGPRWLKATVIRVRVVRLQSSHLARRESLV